MSRKTFRMESFSMSVRRILENAIDRQESRVTFRSISESTGVCPSLISRYFAQQKDLTFYDVLKITRYITPSEEVEVMQALTVEYCDHPKPANVRALLLYLVNAKMYDEMTALGDSIPAKNRECTAWYELIQVFADHKENAISSYELVSRISTKCYDTDEFRALKNLLNLFGEYANKSFYSYFEIAKEAERCTKAIKNEFIRECLFNTVCEQLSIAFLYQKSDTNRSRFYARQVRESYMSCGLSVINSEYTMGVSYMFEDFGKALTHLNSCVTGLRKLGKNDRALKIEQEDIAFLYNYWRVETLQGSERFNVPQKVYAEFLNGDVLQAQQDVLNLEDTTFNIFLKGLILEDDSFLVASCMQYRLKGNEFFANLPLKYVKQDALKSVLKIA